MCLIVNREIKIPERFFSVYKVVRNEADCFRSQYYVNGPLLSGLQECGRVRMAPKGPCGWYAFFDYKDAINECMDDEVVLVCVVRKQWIIQAGIDKKGRCVARFSRMVFPLFPQTVVSIEKDVNLKTINSPLHTA